MRLFLSRLIRTVVTFATLVALALLAFTAIPLDPAAGIYADSVQVTSQTVHLQAYSNEVVVLAGASKAAKEVAVGSGRWSLQISDEVALR